MSCPIYTSNENVQLAKKHGFKAINLNHIVNSNEFLSTYTIYDKKELINTIIGSDKNIQSFLSRANFLQPENTLISELLNKSYLFNNSEIRIKDSLPYGDAARYYNNGKTHVIEINLEKLHDADYNSETIINILLHEIIHAYTNNIFNLNEAVLNDNERLFVNKINTLYNNLKKESDYGFTNPKEFLAEYFTNASFKEKIKQQHNNIFIRIVNSIKKLFNIETKLDVVESTFYTYINNISKYSTPLIYTNSYYEALKKDYDDRKKDLTTHLKDLIDNVEVLNSESNYSYQQQQDLRNYYIQLIETNQLQTMIIRYSQRVSEFLKYLSEIELGSKIEDVYKIHNEIKFHLNYLLELEKMNDENLEDKTVKTVLAQHNLVLSTLRQDMLSAHNIMMINLKKIIHTEFLKRDTYVKATFKQKYEKEFNATTTFKRNTPEYFRNLEKYITDRLNEEKEIIEEEKSKRIRNILDFGQTDVNYVTRFFLPLVQNQNQLLRWVAEKAGQIDYELNLKFNLKEDEGRNIKAALKNDDLSWFEEIIDNKRTGFFIAPLKYGLFDKRQKEFREHIKNLTNASDISDAYNKFNQENYEQKYTDEYYYKRDLYTTTQKTDEHYVIQTEINTILNTLKEETGTLDLNKLSLEDNKRLGELYQNLEFLPKNKIKKLSSTERIEAQIFWQTEHETKIKDEYYTTKNKLEEAIIISKEQLNNEKEIVANLNAENKVLELEILTLNETLLVNNETLLSLKEDLKIEFGSLKAAKGKSEKYKEGVELQKLIESQKEELKTKNDRLEQIELELDQSRNNIKTYSNQFNIAQRDFEVWDKINHIVKYTNYGEEIKPLPIWTDFIVTNEDYYNEKYVEGEKTLKESIYKNTEFDNIINKTPERKAFYDWYLNTRLELDKTTKIKKLGYKLPIIEKTSFEDLRNVEGDGFFNKVKNYIHNRFKLQETDKVDYGIDYNNILSKQIPIFYRSDSVDPESLSQHYIDTLLLDYYNVTRWKKLTETQPEFEIIKDIVKELKINKKEAGLNLLKRFSNDNSTIEGIDSNNLKALEAFLDTFLYSKKKLNEKGAVLIDNIINYTSKVLIGGNLISAIQNITMGEASFLLESLTNKRIAKSSFAFAHKEYFKLSNSGELLKDLVNNTETGKLTKLYNLFQPINTNLEHPSIDQSNLERNKDVISYGGLKLGSHMIKNLTMIGSLHQIPVYNDNLELQPKSLYQYLINNESTENIFVGFNNEIVPYNEDTIFKIGKFIRAINNQLHENEQHIEAKRYAVYRVLLQMRNWLASGVRRRWIGYGDTEKVGFMFPVGESQGVYDEELEDFYEGYYVTTLRFITNSIRELKLESFKMFNSEHWEKLTNTEQQNVKKFFLDGVITLSALFIGNFFIQLAKEMQDDDDDDFWKFQSAYYFYRMNTELRFYYDPSAMLDIIKSPAPIFSLMGGVTDLAFQFINDLGNIVVDGDLERYKSGIRKDTSKLFHKTTKVLPYYRQYEGWKNIEQRLKFL